MKKNYVLDVNLVGVTAETLDKVLEMLTEAASSDGGFVVANSVEAPDVEEADSDYDVATILAQELEDIAGSDSDELSSSEIESLGDGINHYHETKQYGILGDPDE